MTVWMYLKNIYFMWIRSTIFNREGLRLGHDSAWNEGCIFNCEGGLTIGNNVIIGPHVCINTSNHNFTNSELPIRLQGWTNDAVNIEDDVWIGANAVILPGVTIGKGAVIGAASVVTKSIPAYSVAVGNPAHVIRERVKPKPKQKKESIFEQVCVQSLSDLKF